MWCPLAKPELTQVNLRGEILMQTRYARDQPLMLVEFTLLVMHAFLFNCSVEFAFFSLWRRLLPPSPCSLLASRGDRDLVHVNDTQMSSAGAYKYSTPTMLSNEGESPNLNQTAPATVDAASQRCGIVYGGAGDGEGDGAGGRRQI